MPRPIPTKKYTRLDDEIDGSYYYEPSWQRWLWYGAALIPFIGILYVLARIV